MIFLKKQLLNEFDEKGLVVVPNVLNLETVGLLKQELLDAIKLQNTEYPDVPDKGMVHNCMLYGNEMCKLLSQPTMHEYLSKLLSPTCILYAYQSSSLLPGKTNYGSRIHVDTPRFIKDYITNIGVIFPLNDFTLENGATHYLEGSHKSPDVPTDEEFYKKASRGTCKKGDMILFNARLFHAAGKNLSNDSRHAITINVCRSYMRQRFDFPKLVPQKIIDELDETGKRFLGLNVRMPASLKEFYLPEEQRLYKANQG
ncbi:MAG: hypothetical protein S4CHLAM6_01340 [Chlamydiae bacterium]|nr:hypothetical protein [Chlamydiota bacterium]